MKYYIYPRNDNFAVICSDPPDYCDYWEFTELPPGDGPLCITNDGELYRLDPPQFEEPVNEVADSSSLISALID